MVSTRKKKSQNERQLVWLDDLLNEFIIGNGKTVTTMEKETLIAQAKDHHEDFDRIIDNASQNQVLGSITDDRNRNAVDSAVIAAKKCMHDAILTAMRGRRLPADKIYVWPESARSSH